MDELDLYELLSQDRRRDRAAREFLAKTKTSSAPQHLTAAAFGSGIAAGLAARSSDETNRRKAVVNAAYRGALVGGISSLALAGLRKHAGFSDYVRQAFEAGKQMAQAKKPEIIGGLAGAAIAGGIGLGVSKRWKKGQPSLQERDAAGMVAGQRAEREKLREKGKKPGFRHKVEDVAAHTYAGLSKAMAEHPAAGTLMYAGAGARTGARLARHLKEWAT